jgi:hypothetical protein
VLPVQQALLVFQAVVHVFLVLPAATAPPSEPPSRVLMWRVIVLEPRALPL